MSVADQLLWFATRFKDLFRDDELEHGEAIMRDGFQTLVVSAMGPAEYEAKLGESIPLGYMQPLYLMHPEWEGRREGEIYKHIIIYNSRHASQ